MTRDKFAGWPLNSISAKCDLTSFPGIVDLKPTPLVVKVSGGNTEAVIMCSFSESQSVHTALHMQPSYICNIHIMYYVSSITWAITAGYPGGTRLSLHHCAIMLATDTAGSYQMAA